MLMTPESLSLSWGRSSRGGEGRAGPVQARTANSSERAGLGATMGQREGQWQLSDGARQVEPGWGSGGRGSEDGDCWDQEGGEKEGQEGRGRGGGSESFT